MKKTMAGLVAVTLAVATGLLVAACETGKGTHALTVEPLEANLLGETNNLVTFTVVEGLRELSLPLRWDVANTDLGHIIHQAGNRATYERRTPHGINSVYVEDQYGASGLASVRQ